MTEIILKDASIIIDLLKINLFSQVVSLPYEFFTTDLIIGEIEDEQQRMLIDAFIVSGSIEVIEANEDDLSGILQLFSGIGKLSFPDSSVLYFAERMNATIFTGDNRMRKEAENRSIPVHGILWVFKSLIEHKIITPLTASKKLQLLMDQNSYLPKEECERLLQEWKRSK